MQGILRGSLVVFLVGAVSAGAVALLVGVGRGQHGPSDRPLNGHVEPLKVVPAGAAAPEAADVKRLEQLLEDVIRAKDALAQENAELRAQFATLRASMARPANDSRPGGVAGQPLSVGPDPEPVYAEPTEVDLPQLNRDRLYASHLGGASPVSVEDDFRAAAIEIAMLEERAHREGWARDPLLDEERLSIRHALQARVGPEAYLAGLYASGEPNRLNVTGVQPGSSAAASGLQPGDVVLAVNRTPVFDQEDYRAALQEMAGDTSGELEVLRAGRTLRLPVKGPVAGVEVYAESVSPEDYYAEE